MKYFGYPLLPLVLLGAMAVLVFTGTDSAQAQVSPTLTISPAKFDLRVEPGQLAQVEIKLTNKSTVAIPLKAVSMDFRPKGDTGEIELDQPLPDHSAKDWLSTSPSELLLPPGETKVARVTINAPETTTPASYFAVMMFQSQLPSNYFESQGQAHIIPWIGSLFLLTVGDPTPLNEQALTIERFSVPKLTYKKELPVELVVRNNTAYHLQPSTEFRLQTLRGTVVGKVNETETTVMPGSTRVIQGTFSNATRASSSFFYKVGAAVLIAGVEKHVSSDWLAILSWVGLGLLLAALVSLGLGYYHRHHLNRAVRLIINYRRRKY